MRDRYLRVIADLRIRSGVPSLHSDISAWASHTQTDCLDNLQINVFRIVQRFSEYFSGVGEERLALNVYVKAGAIKKLRSRRTRVNSHFRGIKNLYTYGNRGVLKKIP